jgi:hypothetical protein
MFAGYEKAIAEMAVEVLGKPKKPKILPVDSEFLDINQLTRYQLQKSILPAFTRPDPPDAREAAGPKHHHRRERAKYVYEVYTGNGWEKAHEKLPFITLRKLEALDTRHPWPENQKTVMAAAAYVVSAGRSATAPRTSRRRPSKSTSTSRAAGTRP